MDRVTINADDSGYMGERLEVMDADQFHGAVFYREGENALVITGTPKRYYVSEEDILYLDPVPGSVIRYDLWHHNRPSDMTTDSDTPDMAEIFHPLVLEKSRSKVAYNISGMEQQYLKAEQEYQRQLVMMLPEANKRTIRSTRLRANMPSVNQRQLNPKYRAGVDRT
jgi:hypothetical protein